MKKALTITIAGTLFTIEEDAYQKLEEYLKSVASYFKSHPDNKEIIRDIETRIAEQLMSRPNKDAVVTINDVETLILTIGKVEDFSDEHKSQPNTSHKLYRNPDNVWIMGVASGIAAYVHIDPLVIRIGFIILTLITGIAPGILVYIFLVLIVPAAHSNSEKNQMKGEPIDVEIIKENLKKTGTEFKDNIKKSSSDLKEYWHNKKF